MCITNTVGGGSARTDVVVALVGEDGNVFAIIGRVSRALRRAGYHDLAREYVQAVTRSKSYDEALAITMAFVEVE